MAGSDKHQEQLERLVDELLRDQPLRHAPNTLEAHVFAEIARRAALPWWRKSFTHWPLLARVAFLIASYGFVRLTLLGAMSVVDALRSEPVTEILTPADREAFNRALRQLTERSAQLVAESVNETDAMDRQDLDHQDFDHDD